MVSYVTKLQNEDGSFCGDQWGEVDTRFSMCAVACLALLVCRFTDYNLHIIINRFLDILFILRESLMLLILIMQLTLLSHA